MASLSALGCGSVATDGYVTGKWWGIKNRVLQADTKTFPVRAILIMDILCLCSGNPGGWADLHGAGVRRH
jgi:hypothetical protein